MESAGYTERRPYAVPESLAELAGPTSGPVKLPSALAWTGRTEYNLDDAADQIVFYERVLVEAPDAGAVTALLDAEMLRSCWSRLFLPAAVRRAWEHRFAVLSAAA